MSKKSTLLPLLTAGAVASAFSFAAYVPFEWETEGEVLGFTTEHTICDNSGECVIQRTGETYQKSDGTHHLGIMTLRNYDSHTQTNPNPEYVQIYLRKAWKTGDDFPSGSVQTTYKASLIDRFILKKGYEVKTEPAIK